MAPFALLLCSWLSGCAQDPDVPRPAGPPEAILGGDGPNLMRADLAAAVAAAAARPLPESREQHQRRLPGDRAELMRCLGLDPLPPRTPLNARVTGVLPRAGYRVEKLVYESLPGFHVTAHLYVPEDGASGPRPVIVNPHGHWQHKKAEPVVQARAIAQALAGYLAIVVDSPGHSFEGDAPIERRWQGPHGDWTLGMSVGSVTGVYVWDLMRALDYLETRPEADLGRVGITGASGGGLATLYAFAAEPRFTCAVPVVYASSLEVNPNNGCLCNHVPGTLRVGDRSDVLAIRAPAPVLVIGANEDGEFPPAGMRRTGEKIRAIWQLYGVGANARWMVFDSRHDYNRPMREQAMGFFDQHLRGRGDGSPVVESAFETADALDPDLRVLAEPPEGAKTLRMIAAERLAAASGSWAQTAELNGGFPPELLRGGGAAAVTVASGEGWRALRIPNPVGPDLPAVLHSPKGAPRALVVLVSEAGWRGAAADFDLDRLADAGFACLALDVRGFGELAGLDPRLRAYLGVSAPFLMAQDALVAAGAARSSAELPVAVVGRGECASQVALFAGLMAPELAFVAGLDGLRGYSE
ncbi:MAG: prolyl oligopeptidase family serine peptidase, partial [Planctomycetes bacterium]|nr:prolyl oligopeptidase family serine peptidase [Planctomycetota bacterium]